MPGCSVDNVNYNGHDIGNIPNIASEEECRNLCQSNQNCKFWTWGKPSYYGQNKVTIKLRCFFKSSDADKREMEGVVSGTKTCNSGKAGCSSRGPQASQFQGQSEDAESDPK